MSQKPGLTQTHSAHLTLPEFLSELAFVYGISLDEETVVRYVNHGIIGAAPAGELIFPAQDLRACADYYTDECVAVANREPTGAREDPPIPPNIRARADRTRKRLNVPAHYVTNHEAAVILELTTGPTLGEQALTNYAKEGIIGYIFPSRYFFDLASLSLFPDYHRARLEEARSMSVPERPFDPNFPDYILTSGELQAYLEDAFQLSVSPSHLSTAVTLGVVGMRIDGSLMFAPEDIATLAHRYRPDPPMFPSPYIRASVVLKAAQTRLEKRGPQV